MTAQTETLTSAQRPPILLVVLGLALIAVAIVLSPDFLRALGPMRASLESDMEMVRRSAYLEVWAIRICALVAGVAALSAAAFWQRVCESSFVRAVLVHEPELSRPTLALRSVPNASFFVMLSVVVLGLGFVAMGPDGIGTTLFQKIGQEDGLIEQASALSFLVAAGFAGAAARQSQATAGRIVLSTLAVGFVLCFGEEISWGQRALGIETPEVIARVNVQGEINLHNLVGYAADHVFIAGILAYGALLPALTAIFPFLHRLCSQLGLPIASLGLAVGFLLASGIHEWTVYRVLPRQPFRPQELRELASAVGLALLMWEAYRPSPRASR